MSVRSLLRLNKGNRIHLGSLKATFVKVSQNFIQISLKVLPNLTDFSSQQYGMYAFSCSVLFLVAADGNHLAKIKWLNAKIIVLQSWYNSIERFF